MEHQNGSDSQPRRDFTLPLFLSGGIIAVICMVLCVVIYFSRSLTNKSMTSNRQVAELTATPLPCAGVPPRWELIMEDNFDSNQNAWYLGEHTDEVAISNTAISTGVLHFEVEGFKPGGVYYYTFPSKNKSKADFYLTSKVRQVDGEDDSQYGLIFRVKEGRQHFFSIDNNGFYYLKTRNEQGNWKDIIFGDYSEHILPGMQNELTILARNDHFIFCINQYNVGEVDNAKYPLGEFGIGILLVRPNESGAFEYDDFTIYAPK